MVTFPTNETIFLISSYLNYYFSISDNGKIGRVAEYKLYGWAFEPTMVLFSIFRSKERTSFRWMKGTYLKANFRLWLESGWRHVLVGAELGKVLLTVQAQGTNWAYLQAQGPNWAYLQAQGPNGA